jgi:hypothetical protein
MAPTPKPTPSASANMGPVNAGGAAVTPTPTPTPKSTKDPKNTVNNPNLRKIPVGVQTDWEKFINGGITINPAGTAKGGVQSETYVTIGGIPGDITANAVGLFASQDGKGYILVGIDQAVRETLSSIPVAQRAYVKKQLQPYYPNSKAFQTSMTQPVNEQFVRLLQAYLKKTITKEKQQVIGLKITHHLLKHLYLTYLHLIHLCKHVIPYHNLQPNLHAHLVLQLN